MRAWIAVVLLLGCSKKEDKPAPPAQPQVAATTADAAAGTAECQARAARLEGELRELAAAKPGFMPLVQGINAPSAKDAQPIKERGWVIAVARDGTLSVQGHRFDKTAHTTVIEDVRSYTDQVYRVAVEKFVMDGGSGRDFSVPLYIWADRDAPARVIAELVAYGDPDGPMQPRAKKAASAGDPPPPEDDPPPPEEEDGKAAPPPKQEDAKAARKQAIEEARKAGILGKPGAAQDRVPLRLLVAADGAAQPPAPAAKLPAGEPESTQELVKQLRAAIGACPDIITTLGTSSLEGLPAKEAAKLAKDVPAGLVKCECKVGSPDALADGMRAWFGAWAPQLGWVAMPKLDAKDKRTIGQVLKP